MTIPQAAVRLTVSKKTAWRMKYAGMFEVVQLGRSVRVTEDSVEDIINRGTTAPSNPPDDDDEEINDGDE